MECARVAGDIIGSALPHIMEDEEVDHITLDKERDTDLDESVIVLAHFHAKSERVYELDREPALQAA